jgi:hypothetical protein
VEGSPSHLSFGQPTCLDNTISSQPVEEGERDVARYSSFLAQFGETVNFRQLWVVKYEARIQEAERDEREQKQ